MIDPQMKLADIAKVAFSNPLRLLGEDPDGFTERLLAKVTPGGGVSPLVRAVYDTTSGTFVVAVAASAGR